MGLEMHVEAQSMFIDGRGAVRHNPGLADEALAPVAQHEAVGFDAVKVLAFLGERVFHLEQIGEVGSSLDEHLQVHRVPGVVE